MTKPTILLADDHILVLEGLSRLLEEEYEIVGTSPDGKALIADALRLQPDLILLDISMPQMTGIEAARQLREMLPSSKIVIVTQQNGQGYIQEAFRAGAMGYLLKTMIRKELVDAISTVNSGRKYIPSEIATMVAERLDTEELSPREVDVLRGIAQGLSNKMIATKLGISENTVKGHVKEIVAKLGAEDRANAVFVAMQRGILNLF